MVVGDVGRRDDQGGLAHAAQFGQGGRPRPAEHQIRRRQHPGGVEDILPHIGVAVFRRNAGRFQLFRHVPVVMASRCVNQVEVPLPAHQRKHVHEGLVHMPRAEGAPHGHHQRHVRRKAEFRLGLFLRIQAEGAAHRGSAHPQVRDLVVILSALIVADENAAHMLGEQFGRQARNRVALVQQRRDPQFGGLVQHRIADVSARAQHGVGPELLQDPPRLVSGLDDVFHGGDVVPHIRQMMAPAQIGDVQGADGETVPRDQVHLHLALGPQEEDLAIRKKFPQPLCHSDRGIDVTRGPAAGKNKFHSRTLKTFQTRSGTRRPCTAAKRRCRGRRSPSLSTFFPSSRPAPDDDGTEPSGRPACRGLP